MTSPLVSVIMPVYNREALVARAVESVLAQTYPHWEFIVVDDGSTDGTRRVLDTYGSRLTVLSQPNAGPDPARNFALQHARGELIAFIDSDDLWYPDRLASQLPLFDRPEVGLVYGNAALVSYDQGEPQRLKQTFFDLFPPHRGRAFRALAYENFIPQTSVLVRRACFEKLGGFGSGAPTAADYVKWSQIAIHYEIDYVPTCIVEYTFHVGNISRGPLRLYFAPVELFEEVIRQTPEPAVQQELRRTLFYFEWNLSLALLREAGARMWQAMSKPVSPLPSPPSSQRLGWMGGFIWHKLVRAWRRLRRG